ncbi:uncharacterized protein B0P05DRAFT_148141 [Gilbertella persicaria]|uniref:uncharacterized protein n=1 Tax=Gilbertella persicaria TaxID=101096 RepID=UPI00221EEE15|nr:uncharacterized protein B0P05DRAFT_148141 [Gilbertella persicaria]KAI8075928.1 hypothetical protein B0P05DRAFT_148141 [Gilbertella persicaria]
MMTAPTELRRLSYSSASTHKRPISVASTIARHRYDDDSSSMNPWVLHPSVRQYRVENPSLGSGHTPLSASSSITAKQQQLSVLGPATKRALDVLQHEIDILSERIDGLRKELMDGDQINKRNKSKPLVSDEDGWKWVFKVSCWKRENVYQFIFK